MAAVLTENSNVTCGHSGTVSTSGLTKLTINGQPVLLKNGINGQLISNCQTQPASDASGMPTDKPCSAVTAVTAGESTKLKIEGTPVMLNTLKGTTDGMVTKVTPQTKLKATAIQNKLMAI